jgi:nucleoside-diphosphate-sugar epimerase
MMGFGIFLQAIFFGIPFSVPPPKPLSGRLVIDTMEVLKTRAAILPPSLIENIYGTTEGRESLCRLNCLCFGGAPLAPNTGEILRDRVTLLSVIGSTEMGVLLAMTPEKSEEWSYFDWAPNFNIAMDPVGDDLCELVIQRGKNRNFHGIFHTFPDLVEYRSKDLFRQHPTKGNLWQYAGRLDDIIVLSNGEKFNPVTMEKLIEAHPLVSRALVVGEGQFQSALLIEPNWDLWNPNVLSSMDGFVDALWPHVQVANNAVPAYGHVMKDRIRIASRCKPFKTTPKGSTQRRRVNEDYKEEIQTLYTNQHSVSLEFPETPSLHSVTDFIRRAVHNQFCQREIGDLDDFYSAGFDSLQTVALANTLDNAIRSKHPGPAGDKFVTVQTIYGHSSIKNLSSFITSLLCGTQGQADSSRCHRIATTVETLTNNLPKRRQPVIPRGAREGSVILLTGSTGSLGSYILDSLLGVSSVRKIYCLNRTRDAESRQKMSHQEKGLKLWPLNNGRVEFVHACFTEDHLGLSIATYSKLLEEVDIIIHNAWKVDFNQSLASFQPMIKSVRALVDFGSQSKYCPHLFFVSSISTIAGWKPSMGNSSAPEGPILSPDASLKQGYAESKHVAERLCYEASKTVGIPTTVLRVGQVAGPTYAMGKWNPREWLPALIMSSTSLGKVPRTLGSANEINWIPVVRLSTLCAL